MDKDVENNIRQNILPNRWTPLRYHPVQHELWNSKKRFIVNPAGRRSGKTELAKRKLIRKAMEGTKYDDPRFFAGAPTRDQAKRIYWDDLKRLSPVWLLAQRPNESELSIYFLNGSMIQVLGMDKPERIEGSPWDGGILDEYGNMKKRTWGEHVRPALADRGGWCDLIGVPEGRNHYYDIAKTAQADETGEWAYFHWLSSDILPECEIEAAKKDLDELTYKQEYEGSFVNFTGRAYYGFGDDNLAKIVYNPDQSLILAMDFNVEPGVAAVMQEKGIKDIKTNSVLVGESVTAVVGEVYIPRNSNTILVCNKFINDFGKHRGKIYVYGDATGGSRKTSAVDGSDWDLVKKALRRHFNPDQLIFRIPRENPSERDRINSVNSRLRNMEGRKRLLVDPMKAPRVVKDFEGVRLVEGGSGEIDKKATPELTHLSDAVGYYIWKEFPVRKVDAGMSDVKGL